MHQQARVRITLGIIALVFFALLVYSTAPRIVQAATGGFTQTQAYSSNFSTTALPTDGTTQATLTKILFTVSAKRKDSLCQAFWGTIWSKRKNRKNEERWSNDFNMA